MRIVFRRLKLDLHPMQTDMLRGAHYLPDEDPAAGNSLLELNSGHKNGNL
jgi:hypothetical protein